MERQMTMQMTLHRWSRQVTYEDWANQFAREATRFFVKPSQGSFVITRPDGTVVAVRHYNR